MFNLRTSVYSRIYGPMTVKYQFVPKKDSIEVTAFYKAKDGMMRLDYEVYSENIPRGCTDDELNRFLGWEIDRAIMKYSKDDSGTS